MTKPTTRLIQSITVRSFRSLANIENLKLPKLTVLIGPNGAGKSNFIRFFDMLGWMLGGQNLQEFIIRHGGGDDQLFMGARKTPRMDAEICIETARGFSEYRFGLAHVTAGDKLIFVDEAYRYRHPDRITEDQWHVLDSNGKEANIVEVAQQKPPVMTAKIVVNFLNRCTVYQFHDTSEKANIRLPWDYTDNTLLRPDGANLAPILLRLQKQDITRYKLITRQISRILPTFGDFVLQPAYGKVELRWGSKYSDKTFGAHLTSDGSLRLFCLLTLLNLPKEMLPDVLFLDEPELGLHPHAITLVSAMLKRLAHDHQIIIATQSPYMVDCFELENIIVADLKDGATSLKTMSRTEYQQWLDDDYRVSDLWLKEVIGGSP